MQPLQFSEHVWRELCHWQCVQTSGCPLDAAMLQRPVDRVCKLLLLIAASTCSLAGAVWDVRLTALPKDLQALAQPPGRASATNTRQHLTREIDEGVECTCDVTIAALLCCIVECFKQACYRCTEGLVGALGNVLWETALGRVRWRGC